MATITLSLTGTIDGTQQTVTSAGTIDDAVLPYFFQTFNNGGINPTEADTFKSFANRFANETIGQVQSYVRANLPIPTITVTPQ